MPRRSYTGPIAALAALAALFAPATLTGVGPVDAVQRGLLAGLVTFVGAHGRRRTWLLAGGLCALPASGWSMALVLVGLAVAVASTQRQHRPRRFGAVAVGCFVNAILWYPSHDLPWGAIVGVVACTMLVISGAPSLRRHQRASVRIGLVTVGAVAVVACGLAAVAVLQATSAVRSGSDAAADALAAARDGDASAAEEALQRGADDFDRASSHLDGLLTAPARLVPGVAQQLAAVRTTVEQGSAIAAAADDLVATADYDQLQYEGRLDLDQVSALIEPTARADAALAEADRRLTDVQGGRLLPPLRTRIEAFSDKIEGARRDTVLARSLLAATPQLFGADATRHYLVIFLTPAELRGAGGFIGSYAELRADDGAVDLVRSGRIDDLLDAAPMGTRTISGPEDYLARYGQYRPQDFLQDVTFSPHFPSSAQVMAELYPQSGGTQLDGVIGVDPTGLAALLELTGPVLVEGMDEPLSAENAVEVLTRRQYLELGTRAERGEVLASAVRSTFDRLISSALPAPRRLADVLSPAARAGHLRLWSPDRDEQDLFTQLGADGSLAIPKGADGFSVVQRNVGNNKIDAYLHRDITYEATIDARTGDLRSTLRIAMTNDLPQGVELPPAVADNTRAAPPGSNVTIVTVHTPNVVTGATLDGVPVTLGPGSERGMYAWDTPQFTIPPGETVVLEVDLAGSLDLRDGYDLRILPQPVANPDELLATLRVRGGHEADTGRSELTTVDDGPIGPPIDRTVALRR